MKKDKIDKALDKVIAGKAILYLHPKDYKQVKNYLAKNPNDTEFFMENIKSTSYLEKGKMLILNKKEMRQNEKAK